MSDHIAETIQTTIRETWVQEGIPLMKEIQCITGMDMVAHLHEVFENKVNKICNTMDNLQEEVNNLRATNVEIIKLLSDIGSGYQVPPIGTPRLEVPEGMFRPDPSKPPLPVEIVGINTEPLGVQASGKVTWLFLGGLEKKTGLEEIYSYLKKKWPGILFIIFELNSKGHSKAFKVGTYDLTYHQLMKPEVWPAGVVCKPFEGRKLREVRTPEFK